MRSLTCRNCWCLLVVAFSAMGWAAGPKDSPDDRLPPRAVDVFEGIAAGELDVVLYPRDSTTGTVTVKNKTDQPLTVKLPAAFAGVPILAQRRGGGGGGGMGGMGGGGMGGGGMGGGMQGMGMGMMGGMGGGMGMGMGGMGGGMFNVGPDKIHKVKIAAVCLDHGLTDPSPRVPYKLIPIESYAKDPAVGELIKLMCAGKIDQHSAQASAWHLQNGLSWDELRRKIGIKHVNRPSEPYFTTAQLQRAFVATRTAHTMAERLEPKDESLPSIGDVLAGQQQFDRIGR